MAMAADGANSAGPADIWQPPGWVARTQPPYPRSNSRSDAHLNLPIIPGPGPVAPRDRPYPSLAC
jgi:hypothetical protein